MAFAGNAACYAFKLSQWTGGVNFATDSFKLALYTNAADLGPATMAYTAVGEVVAPGYIAGGALLTTLVQPAVADETVYTSFADITFPAAVTARGALIYKVGGPAVCVLDFGADKTSTTAFTVQFPPATANDAILRVV